MLTKIHLKICCLARKGKLKSHMKFLISKNGRKHGRIKGQREQVRKEGREFRKKKKKRRKTNYIDKTSRSVKTS